MPTPGISLDLAGEGKPQEKSTQENSAMAQHCRTDPVVTMAMERRRSESISEEPLPRVQHKNFKGKHRVQDDSNRDKVRIETMPLRIPATQCTTE